MTTPKLLRAGALSSCAAMLLSAGTAQAAYVIDAVESGGHVVFTGWGSFNVSELGAPSGNFGRGIVAPSFGNISLRPGNTAPSFATYVWTGAFSGPFSFGPGGSTRMSSASGSLVGFSVARGATSVSGLDTMFVSVPFNYISGSDLGTTTAQIDNATFLSLGMTPGQYVWTWGSGASADSFTLNIGPVPEPGTWAMMIAGFGLMGAALRRRPRVNVAFA